MNSPQWEWVRRQVMSRFHSSSPPYPMWCHSRRYPDGQHEGTRYKLNIADFSGSASPPPSQPLVLTLSRSFVMSSRRPLKSSAHWAQLSVRSGSPVDARHWSVSRSAQRSEGQAATHGVHLDQCAHCAHDAAGLRLTHTKGRQCTAAWDLHKWKLAMFCAQMEMCGGAR